MSKNYTPDDAGNWQQLPVNKIISVELGNGSRFDMCLVKVEEPPAILVSVFCLGQNLSGSYVFSQLVHPSYAEEKLNLLPGDAKPMADLINEQLGIVSSKFGTYGADRRHKL